MLLTYQIVHWVYAVSVALLVLFEMNMAHLCILLLVVSSQTAGLVLMQGCPLTLLERRHTTKTHKQALQRLGIGYECDHEYESSLETMIHVWLAISLKLLVLMLARMFYGPVILSYGRTSTLP